MAIFLKNAPPTEEGAKLDLTAEMEENCKVVYKMDGEGGAVFAEHWNSQTEYSDEYVILPVRSAYYGITQREYTRGEAFANVEGSTSDPCHGATSWIQLLIKNLGQYYDCTTCCAQNGYINLYNDSQKRIDACNDNVQLVGGHIMPPYNANEDLYPRSGTLNRGNYLVMLPICNRHNTHYETGTGAGYYMRLRRNMRAMILSGYLQAPHLQELLDTENKSMGTTHNVKFSFDEFEREMLEKSKRIQKYYKAGENGELALNSNIYIGCGINVITARGPISSEITGMLLDSKIGPHEYIDHFKVHEGRASSVESDSFLEVFTSVNIEAEIRTGEGIPFFSGGLSAKYGESRKVTSTAKFFGSVVEIAMEKHVLKAKYANTDRFKTLLDAYVLEDINNARISPSELFGLYGTHIIKSADIGGSIQVTSVYHSSEELKSHEFKAAMDAACSYVSVSGKTDLTDDQRKILSSTDIYAYSFGGRPNLLAGRLTSIVQMTSLLELWGQSMEDSNNYVLAQIHKYEPIWKFADDPARQKQIEDEFYKVAKEQGKDVSKYIKKTMPSDLVGLLTNYNDSTKYYVYRIPEEYVRRYSEFMRERVRGVSLVGAYVCTDDVSKLCLIKNDDGTVSFQHCESGKYLSIILYSSDPKYDYMNKDQLYFTGTYIGEREKFFLEETAKGSKKYRLKAKHNDSYIYSCENLSSSPTLCADKSKGKEILEFEITYI